jgi:S1-C subfamily serine protease
VQALAIIVLGLFWMSMVEAATVYKWVDKDGRVSYSQTPPPDPEQQVTTRTMSDGTVDASLGPYCASVRKYARSIAQSMMFGRPLESAVASAGEVDRQFREWGAVDSQVREIAYFVYTMEAGLRSGHVTTDGIATLAHSKCMSGNFAILRGRKADARASGGRSGTGWFAARGVVVTSLHVVDGATRITLFHSDGGESEAQLASSDAEHDIAVLSTERRDTPGLPVRGEGQALGAAVFTIGFPHAGLMGVKPKLSNGVISSTAGIQDDPSSYQISLPVQAGNSGGPLLDMNGAVVGMISSKLRAGHMLERTGDLTENVNYAVKSSHIAAALRGIGGAQAGSAGTLEQLAATAEVSVVRIVVE